MASVIGISEPVAELASSTNTSSYAIGAFTPAAYSFLVVLVFADGTVAAAPTMTGGNLTWTRQQRIVYNTTDMACIFTAPVGASPVSTNPTFDCTGDNATGVVMMAFQVIGYDQVTPIVQSDSEARTAANPTDTWNAMDTNNGYIAGFGKPLNPPVSTPPADWVETADIGHTVPVAGAASAYRVNGETGTTIIFTSASGAYGILAIEIHVGNVSGAGGIATGEALGSPAIILAISGVGGIASSEAIGALTVSQAVSITGVGGIAGEEAMGQPAIKANSIGVGGIAGEEAMGQPAIRIAVSMSGIPGAEAFGNPAIAFRVSLAGIPTGEAFGSPAISENITGVGSIAGGEAFGQPTITEILSIAGVGGIASQEAIGQSTIVGDLSGIGGIASAEAMGQTAINVTISGLGEIASAEALGPPSLVAQLFGVGAIVSEELVGMLTISIHGKGRAMGHSAAAGVAQGVMQGLV
jgi:hypothetical protein